MARPSDGSARSSVVRTVVFEHRSVALPNGGVGEVPYLRRPSRIGGFAATGPACWKLNRGLAALRHRTVARGGSSEHSDEQRVMTAVEQLAIWAAAPNDEIFVWLQYPQDDDVFINLGSGDKPYVFDRMRAGDFLSKFEKKPGAANSIARDVLARFQKKADAANNIRAEEIKGIACVIVEGNSPVSPHSPYRLLLSSVESFI